jgi:acetoin utilization protein AcuC
MHEAAALACGATTQALRCVVEGDTRRAFSVAGGLHHAHHDRAAGFCVYNDPAVAITSVCREHPGLRVAYVDIDAHHGDGVEEAFSSSADVLTLSAHESGRYLFPGTGRVIDTGAGRGAGYAINVPLPPLADDACYRMVLRDVIAPALAAFKPDVVFAQCGADTLHSDPLTHLGLTLAGYRDLVAGIITCADEMCAGRICVTGGGGYDAYVGVPRAWTLLLAALLGITLPESVPESWRQSVTAMTGSEAPKGLLDDTFAPLPGVADRVRAETASVIERVRQASPLLEG